MIPLSPVKKERCRQKEKLQKKEKLFFICGIGKIKKVQKNLN
jgi:hypothetical protein